MEATCANFLSLWLDSTGSRTSDLPHSSEIWIT